MSIEPLLIYAVEILQLTYRIKLNFMKYVELPRHPSLMRVLELYVRKNHPNLVDKLSMNS